MDSTVENDKVKRWEEVASGIVEIMKKNKLKHNEVPAVLTCVQSILAEQEV